MTAERPAPRRREPRPLRPRPRTAGPVPVAGRAGTTRPANTSGQAVADAAGADAMAALGLASLLGRVPATAWRAASKAPRPGAEVAGRVAKAQAPEKRVRPGGGVLPSLGPSGPQSLPGHRTRARAGPSRPGSDGTRAARSQVPPGRRPAFRRPPLWPPRRSGSSGSWRAR